MKVDLTRSGAGCSSPRAVAGGRPLAATGRQGAWYGWVPDPMEEPLAPAGREPDGYRCFLAQDSFTWGPHPLYAAPDGARDAGAVAAGAQGIAPSSDNRAQAAKRPRRALEPPPRHVRPRTRLVEPATPAKVWPF